MMDVKRNRIKILLIDSDVMMQVYFQNIFWVHRRDDTYEVSIASSFKEAEEKLTNESMRPNTIFLDVMMPMLGKKNNSDESIKESLSFIKKIKDNKDLSSVRIVVFSNQKDKKIKESLGDLGVSDFLIKGELMPKEIINFVDKIHGSNNKN